MCILCHTLRLIERFGIVAGMGEQRTCQSCKIGFEIAPEDFEFYKNIKVSPPTFCPSCRMVRRMVWRNERGLYARKDSLGNDVVSVFAPDSPYVVYDRDYWWSDEWDPMDYGAEYDFSKPFFEQYNELLKRVPLVAIFNPNSVNSAYANHVTDLKDCYLTFSSAFCENVAYCDRSGYAKDSFDLFQADNCEHCYESVDCEESYKLLFSQNSSKCSDSMFLFDCRNCQDCFGCVGLRNKQYHIFNESYSKEEYEKKIKEFKIASHEGFQALKDKFREFSLRHPRRFARLSNVMNVSGDNISNAKNCHHCFDKRKEVEDTKFAIHAGFGEKNAYDVYGTGIVEWIYESVDSGVHGANMKFAVVVYGSHDVEYVYNCHGSSDLFGCVGLRKKKYCILNKQYSKEEYEELVPKIIEQMNEIPYVDARGIEYRYGEFFPSEISPFAYNETIAQDYVPLSKEGAQEKGFRWREPEKKSHQSTIAASELPDDIKEVDDSILKEVIGCADEGKCNHRCTSAFRLIPSELEFYKELGIPLPRLCPNCRYFERLSKRNPPKLWHRQCMCELEGHEHSDRCPNEFETSYAPEREEKVFCEGCYNQEVV